VPTHNATDEKVASKRAWPAALASYRAALAIDSQWEAASVGVAEVNRVLRDGEFERLLSAGFSALTSEDFAEARERFEAALALRPSSREAREGIAQAEEGAQLDKIQLTEARALAFERRELWDQAIALYRSVLESDPTLVFAQTGLERANARAGLDAKMRNLIDNPNLLLGDTVLTDARALLAAAAAEEQKGAVLEGQIAALSRLVEMASAPIPVRLTSDQLTNVTLYRVGTLGAFATRDVELRPGTYTAIGSRDGYRDVRQTFTVRPGRNLPPISVVCVEPI
jgi:tetratricopeptide (TPR) repeat protein